MHVGYATNFQNPDAPLSDAALYRQELRLAELAEPLGFDSIWGLEHHFTDYAMTPDVLQFLSYMAGKTERVQLGSMVVVLPWHDPVRVAEQIVLLDHLSGGRAILGIGRGLAPSEFEGLRVDRNQSRPLFMEYAELVLNALETGIIEGGATARQPRRALRPRPLRSFLGRTYAAAVSPESIPLMAKLGVRLLIIPQKPWETVRQDFAVYDRVWRETHGIPPPPPLCAGFYFVDEDADRAEEMAYAYIGRYYEITMQFYEMTSGRIGGDKGYEFYKNVTKYIGRHGRDGAVRDFVNLMPWGTPQQVLDKLAFIRDQINMNGAMCHFSYAGLPGDEVERNLRCFARHVLPELKRWPTEPLAQPPLLATPTAVT
jgi:alkanesulfonate monooxygenase SsuD/methylene tetrahydromethanopterin reductase-like flavin-dependent oxidoreductase (luciferase family)